MVSALASQAKCFASQAKCFASQAKGKGSFPSCGISFFPTSIFLSSLSNTKRTIHQFGQILSVVAQLPGLPGLFRRPYDGLIQVFQV